MNHHDFESLNDILEKKASNEELASFFYIASKFLEEYHKSGLYVTNFDPKHIKTNGRSVIFERVDKMTNRILGDEIKSNIEALTSLMVGFYIPYTKSLLPYTKLRELYNEIKYSFPEGTEDYFNKSINAGEVRYYHKYIDDLHNFLNGTHASNLNVNVKTKATPMGKAFSEKMNEVAFANVLIITAMVSLITLVAVLTYVILK